jgi:hypothetical protein
VLNNTVPGATLAMIDEGGADYSLFARTSTIIPGAGKVFGNVIVPFSEPSERWTADSRKLKVSFASPVGTVSIKAYHGGTTAASFGRIEAYNAQDQLLDRYTSGPFTGTTAQVLTISRAAGDIAYVVVRAHADSSIVLDQLEWGTPATTTIDSLGAYSFPYLPAGTYRVKPELQSNQSVTTPAGGFATVTIATGQSAANVNFGVHVSSNPWHNAANPLNVDGDPGNEIAPIDALLVINWLNANPDAPPLPPNGNPGAIGFIDVNNDGSCGPIDALLVINSLNVPGGGGGGEGENQGSSLALITSNSTNARDSLPHETWPEGEEQAPPRNATEYYARRPLQFQNIRGTSEPCTCGNCLDVRDATLADYIAASNADMNALDLEWIASDLSRTSGKRKR